MPRENELTDEERQIRELYRKGHTYAVIGHRVQRSPAWVSYRLQAMVIARLAELRRPHVLCDSFQPESLRQVEQALKAGSSSSDIGRQFSIGPIALHLVRGLHLAGRYRRAKTRSQLTAADRRRIRAAVLEGRSHKQIIDETGATPGAVSMTIREFRESGELPPPRNQQQRPKSAVHGGGPEAVRKLYAGGMQQADIARTVGLSRQRVNQIVLAMQAQAQAR